MIEPIPLENHPADSRVKISADGKCQALTSRMGTGGGNTPMILEPINDNVINALGADIYNLTITGDAACSLTSTGITSTGTNPKVIEVYSLDAGNNHSAVLRPVENIVLDDQGGGQISFRTDGICPTIRAEMHGNIPGVIEPKNE